MIVHSTYYLCINMLYVSFTRPLPSLATVPSHRAELGTGTSRSLDAGAVDADHRESPTVCALEVAEKTHPVDISWMKFGHIKICKIFGEYGVEGPVCSLAPLNLGFTNDKPRDLSDAEKKHQSLALLPVQSMCLYPGLWFHRSLDPLTME